MSGTAELGLASETAQPGVAWNFQIPSSTFGSADGNGLTYTATMADGGPLPSWLSFDPATATFSGTPPTDLIDTIDFKVSANDGSNTISGSFELTVAPGQVTDQLKEYILACDLIKSKTDQVVFSTPYMGGISDYSYLKSFIQQEASAYYGVDPSVFDTATVESTTLLRDFVHKIVYYNDSYQTYFDSLLYQTTLPQDTDIAVLLRNPMWGACGEICTQLDNIYQAFGYTTRYVGYDNNEYQSYDDGHVRLEVLDSETGRMIVQDPTYNLAYVGPDGQLMDFQSMVKEAVDGTYLNDTYLLGGSIYTVYSINGRIDTGLDVANRNFLQRDTLILPADIREGDTLWRWADIRKPNLAAVANSASLVAAISAAKASSQSFDDFINSFVAQYDGYGVQVQRLDGSTDYMIVSRQADGSDVSVLWSSLDTAAGGLDTQFKDKIEDLPGAFANIDYAGSISIIAYPGQYFSIYGNTGGNSSPPSLNYTYANGDSISIQALANGFAQRTQAFASGTTARFVEILSASGRLVESDYYYRDGSSFTSEVDWDGSQSWSNFQQSFDTTGQRAAVLYLNDDGSSFQNNYDTDNSYTWSETQKSFDSAGQLSAVKYVNDDGSSFQSNYDTDNDETWKQMQQSFSASGSRTAVLYINDDGSSFQTNYDVSNVYSWNQMQQSFDFSGRQTAALYINDDGSSFQVNYDPSDVYSWSEMQQGFDNRGARTAVLYKNDDGTSFQANYDTGNAFSWSQIQQSFDASGKLLETLTIYDDGTTQDIIGNTISYSSQNGPPKAIF